MNTISFMSANYVARQMNYRVTEGWMQGENATIAYFEPIATYAERFETLLQEIQSLGFTAIDIWLAHLGPTWATPAHIAIANELLKKYNFTPISLAGWFGATPEEVEKSCVLAKELGVSILGGVTSLLDTDRTTLISLLKQYDLKLALENHPEKTPAELLARLGDDGDGTLGLALDTGWFGTQGYDAADGLEQLQDRLFHVHLKDVLAVGEHDTCRYGAGVVPVERCVRVLQNIGYQGAIAVEHEPDSFNPNEDVKANFAMLTQWLAE